MNRMNVCCLVLMLACLCFTGCASLSAEKMVTDHTSFGVQHSATVALKAGGGSPGVQWFSATIPPKMFHDAVKMSLEKANLFKGIVDEKTADYILNVVLTYAGSHPGFTMHAWVTAKWDLVKRTSGESVWSAEIKGEGSASPGEAFVGTERQYIALERGAKANIDDALSQMGKLHLK